MKRQNKNFIIKLAITGLCLALCWLLPLLTGQIQRIGNMLNPMHLPVILCGFLCGPWVDFFHAPAVPHRLCHGV